MASYTPYVGSFAVFEEIVQEIMMVYQHDNRPWLIGYSGGKDSTLLVSLVFEAVQRMNPKERTKKVYIITSDTMVENPIVCRYMHDSSEKINQASHNSKLNIEAKILYPDVEHTFWSRVIGLGYPTPELPGFRWCTERLKINPMDKFVREQIKENGEVIILLGVRKSESITRSRSITEKEIAGKLLNPHNNITNAYVYNPITEIGNDLVWKFLLKNEGITPWNSNLKYLFSLYQGENLVEEQSVLGEIDEKEIPVTGNSRFGCWCCTIVKEDKSLQNFIDKGSTELIPLREFRNWLVGIRQDARYRDTKRRNGTVYQKANGEMGFGPFTLQARRMILEQLLVLEEQTGLNLITIDELRAIDKMWDVEGDLTRRMLVDTYYQVKGERLPWDQYKLPLFDLEVREAIVDIAEKYGLPSELMTQLIVNVDKNKYFTRSNKVQKEFNRIIGQEWLHQAAVIGDKNIEN